MKASALKYKLIFALLLCAVTGMAQFKPLPVARADSLMKREERPMLVLITADWCTYCFLQKQQISKSKNLQKRAEDFYLLELNADEKEALRFRSGLYRYTKSGWHGVHELAVALNGSERLTFPTWVALDKNYRVIFRYAGVLKQDKLLEVVDAIATRK
ncbi:thioredoxin fold domain-containing protein [Niabella insulamsoli]|uniref:thioredoxin fold domain-containing protein n=1 Tax=Niabella insulamsoli TaxID=3144874 RepID=UPI0031FE239B